MPFNSERKPVLSRVQAARKAELIHRRFDGTVARQANSHPLDPALKALARATLQEDVFGRPSTTTFK